MIQFIFEILLPGAIILGMILYKWDFRLSRWHLLWILPAIAIVYLSGMTWLASF